MRLYVGMAQDVVVKRTIDKNEQQRIAGNLYNREVIVKYEIENFKDKAVTLDIVGEHPRPSATKWPATRAATCSGSWARAPRSRAGRTRRRAPSSSWCSTSSSRPAGPTARPRRSIHKLHVLIKNEW